MSQELYTDNTQTDIFEWTTVPLHFTQIPQVWVEQKSVSYEHTTLERALLSLIFKQFVYSFGMQSSK